MGVQSSKKKAKVGGEIRKDKRSRVLFKATIRWRGGDGEARIRDLSKLGALMEMDFLPPQDEEVLFIRGSVSTHARIAWVDSHRAGLEFAAPVDEKKLMTQPASLPPRAPESRFVPADGSYKRPGVQFFTKMTEEERRLAKKWADQMGLSFEG